MARAFLDVIPVPSSLLLIFRYHLFLLCRILRQPETTVVGNENHNKVESVETMMQLFAGDVIYGDAASSAAGVKNVTLLACFLLAFTFFIQYARHLVHANFLISTPDSEIPVSYVQRAVVWGGNFWYLGPRALHFATFFLFWIFGPIPMFVSSVFTATTLHLLDSNSTPSLQFGDTKKGTRLGAAASTGP
ncbi:unnamed protein product [Victoria cruziana]